MDDMRAADEMETTFNVDTDPVLGTLVNTGDLRRYDLANTMRLLKSVESEPGSSPTRRSAWLDEEEGDD